METRQDVFEWLNGQLRFGIKPGLNRVEWMLETLKIDELPSIHVAGTNGKGSTVAFLRAMAIAEGLNVGTFISPYIIQFEERIMLNGEPIHEVDLVRIANRVRDRADESPETLTEFELLTVMAWLYFHEQQPDLVIWEVGLGGRLDSTNVLKRPLATIVTSIGHDHQGILGDTLEEIAIEKFGIMKRGVPMFHSLDDARLIILLEQQGRTMEAPVHEVTPLVQTIEDGADTTVTYEGLRPVTLGLTGHHQAYNGACAVAVARHLGWKHEAIQKGLETAQHPGRYELISKQPRIILDGAHNAEGVAALVDQLKLEDDVTILVSTLADKDREAMVESLEQVGRVYETTFDFPRARTQSSLIEAGADFVEWKDWLEVWVRTPRSKTLVVTGSLYFISEVRTYFQSFQK
ncbi:MULTISPECIES: folylpolyglutamate synthase/dihydrofolate synthase family protein [unclassified Exiguobacterium]|uniref:bifunctional folylpolyglutamate synthase/dihydrofolate synthase n=1 Tax=unclassified Exiguobacterium TaxID=2644629 RepID=UPI00103F6375|nr:MULTISPECIES: folylpolyglutamate synthase/dihydrofolate synthase family protein [unclassified Exiguobacterium]TCI45920.1 bifunctional folylpolyglutamate synthase/dihydrofolate synthase [Exiguobacterium sp. SH5S32]TCI51677.1 bifunctional folylpolyglutamate synthase/dihydrofolate synthase [Exiguobacterium sp. SH1S4]TCI71663.1 bifunctional folylpolyglutamate synthase/dihydrofolate synthase [Exiguobacterium sp. SH1S1]